jgi:hypothetical protein
MKASTLPMAGIVVSAALSAWAILLWPELFLFSKVVQYPVWAGIFPDPMIPAWCLAFGALGPTWLGPLRRAGVRIALGSLLGPLVGAVAHDMGLGFSFIDVVYQFAWAFIFCFLGPMLLMQLLRFAFSWYRRRAANSSFKPNRLCGSA